VGVAGLAGVVNQGNAEVYRQLFTGCKLINVQNI
jgi:hypothetical protein